MSKKKEVTIVLTSDEVESLYLGDTPDKLKALGGEWVYEDGCHYENDSNSVEDFGLSIYNTETDEYYSAEGSTYSTPVGGHHFYDDTYTFYKS